MNTNDFDIDPNKLGEEWCRQPSLYSHYAFELADLQRKLEATKARLALVEATADQEIRADPESFGLSKVTEPMMKAAVIKHEKVIACQRELLEDRHAVDIARAAVATLDHKKSALQGLVSLIVTEYHAAPKAPAGFRQETTDLEQTTTRSRGRDRSKPK